MNERDLEIATRIAKEVKREMDSHTDNPVIQIQVLKIMALDLMEVHNEKDVRQSNTPENMFKKLKEFFIRQGLGPVESLSIMCTVMSSIFADICADPEKAIRGLTEQLVFSTKTFKEMMKLDEDAKK